MTAATTDTPPVESGTHHLDANIATPAVPAPVDPEPPVPGLEDDLTTAERLADFALAKLRRYTANCPGEVSSHHIELSIRLGELYVRLDAAQVRRRQVEPQRTVVSDGEPDPAQDQFALDEAEEAQRTAEEAAGQKPTAGG